MRNKNLQYPIQVLGQRLAVKLQHCIEHFESFIGQIRFGIDFDNVGKQSGGNWDAICFETNEEIVDERETLGMAELENEGMVRS